MSHLTAERLAALADDTPSAAEAAHLADCTACCREVNAHKRLLRLAADERARIAPPLTSWELLAPQLRETGVFGSEPDDASREAAVRRLTSGRSLQRWTRRAAAVVLLAGGGVLAGRYSAGASPLPGRGGESAIAHRDAQSARGARAPAAATLDSSPAFRTKEDALSTLAAAERTYQQAAAYLVEHDMTTQTLDSSTMYRTRLVALDGVMQATRRAMYEAPHDPLINRYYLATAGAREATLRQLNTTLPAGVQLTRY
jgi:hypothetical protein